MSIVKISVVAQRLGLPASTIRYYEKVGLIKPPSRVSGIRHFDERTLADLHFVKLAQAAGFTLAEIKALQDHRLNDLPPSDLWATFVEKKRRVVRQQIDDLQRTEQILTALLSCECPTVARCIEFSIHSPQI